MTANGLFQIGVFFLVVLALTRPMGAFMVRVFEGERTWLHPALRPLERLIYKLCGIREDQEQRWTGYAASLLTFSLASLLLTHLIQRLQGFLPFNPQGFGTAHAAQGATAMTPDLAFNTAVSFTTNTNWQAYTPETTMSYLTQMVGLATHNFFSAAAGSANDVAKYFAILPAMFSVTYPAIAALNVMRLHSPESAVLAAVIFNALIIIALIPLALRGVSYRPMSAAALLRRNILVYGVGGIVAPFPGIWIIDVLLGWLHLA